MARQQNQLPLYPHMRFQGLSFHCSQHMHLHLPPITFRRNSRLYPADRSVNPLTIFKPMLCLDSARQARWALIDSTPGGMDHSVLVFVDGAAPSNGLRNVRAGCGINYSPDGDEHGFCFPLERVSGEPLTSNRAELRAAHAALTLRHWECDGFAKIVIATDSQYLVSGVNEWALGWERRGWMTSNGKSVANRDLWEMLLGAIEKKESLGVTVQFYLIDRKWNLADKYAKIAANNPDVPTEWQNRDMLQPRRIGDD